MADKTKKIVQIVDADVPSIAASIEQLSSWGALGVFIIAEDIDDLGTFYKIQGQFNDNGFFELLTAGSGTSTPSGPDGDAILGETGDYLLGETGDYMLAE